MSFVFDYQDPLHYRSVELRQLAGRRWQLLLRQKGAFDGDVAGVKATAILPAFDRKVMHQLRIDAPAAGAVQVSIDGELVFAGIFAGPSSGGGIGLASDLTGLYADSFTGFHEALVGSD